MQTCLLNIIHHAITFCKVRVTHVLYKIMGHKLLCHLRIIWWHLSASQYKCHYILKLLAGLINSLHNIMGLAQLFHHLWNLDSIEWHILSIFIFLNHQNNKWLTVHMLNHMFRPRQWWGSLIILSSNLQLYLLIQFPILLLISIWILTKNQTY